MQQEDSNDNTVDKDIEALSNMALQHYQEGHLQQARDECLHILRKQQRPDAILILAKIAHEQREFEVAIERYQQFLEIIPDHAQTHFYLGVVLEELGRTKPAIDHYKKSIGIAANEAAAHRRLGDACSKLQRWEEAIEAYQQVLAIRSEDVGTMMRLGKAFTAAEQWLDSIAVYEQILALQPDNAEVHRHLGVALHKMGHTKKTIECYERTLSLRPDSAGVRIDLARILRQLGKAEEALAQFEHAVNRIPDNVDAHIDVALTLRQLGKPDLAVNRLEQFLGTSPACGEAYYHLSMIDPRQELIPVVEKLLSDPALPKDDTIYCHFALGNFHDSGRSFDEAFKHYLTANTLQRETFNYDIRENIKTVDWLIDVYSKSFIQGKRQSGSDSQLPVFIVGMPRSGTTLIEQILSSHALVHGAGEVEAMPAINLSIAQKLNYASPCPDLITLIDRKTIEECAARYLEELALYSTTAARITDKLPGNFVRIGLIKTLFPEARIIHCQRNPLDNCLSLFFHYFAALTCSFELTELAQYYLDYQRLMSHWQKLFPGEIFNVQYEDLVMNQESVSKQLVDYIGLEWDENCMEFQNNDRNVMSPSNLQVRQPIYKNSMNRWKLYEKHLQPLINVLQSAGERS